MLGKGGETLCMELGGSKVRKRTNSEKASRRDSFPHQRWV